MIFLFHKYKIKEKYNNKIIMENFNGSVYIDPKFMNTNVGGKKILNNQEYLNNQKNIIKKTEKEFVTTQGDYVPNLISSNPIPVNILNNTYVNNSIPFNQSLLRNIDINQTNDSNNIDYNNLDRTNVNNALNDPSKMSIDSERTFNQPRYDQYIDYLFKNGLLDERDNRRRYKTHYLNINSKFRNKSPTIITESIFNLDKDPLKFTKDSSIIFIKHPDHCFKPCDLISLDCIIFKNVILRTIVDDNPMFEIPAGCNLMRINYPHNLPIDYNQNCLEIEISDIMGDNIINNESFLGNIPINFINGKHKIIVNVNNNNPFCSNSFKTPSINYFFIELPKNMQNINPPYNLIEYNFKIKFLYICGVPLNLINTKYPIDCDHRIGYHKIINTTCDGYEIIIPKKLIAVSNCMGGGMFVTVSKIKQIINGFPDANNYKIDLEKVYHNIVSVKLISMEIPNIKQVIKTHNKLYWNLIEDGNYLYEITIPKGNYNQHELINKIEYLMNNTLRYNSVLFNNFKLIYEKCTNTICFYNYKKNTFNQPLGATDQIMTPNTCYSQLQLVITYPNHCLNVGLKIFIENSINHLGIPADKINGEHQITSILDENTFEITLSCIYTINDITDTGGGCCVTIIIPEKFRLRFDLPNTIGGLLGFKYCSNFNSITKFDFVICNNQTYCDDTECIYCNDEYIIDNCEKEIKSIPIDNYLIMKAEPFYTFDSIGPIKQAFAKILLYNCCDNNDKYLFNTFVPSCRYYEDPLHEVSQLCISFYDPDGNLVDFNCLDHSFTLEIVTVNDIPRGTGISANTGKNYNIKI